MTLKNPILECAVALASSLNARAILVAADGPVVESALALLEAAPAALEIIVAGRRADLERIEGKNGRATLLRVPELAYSRVGRIKVALLLGLSKRIIATRETVVCVTGAAGGPLDTLSVLEVGRDAEILGLVNEIVLPASVNQEVFERTLDLATRIAVEGREGKPIGTIFVLADPDTLAPYTKQLIINPFRGYPESERNILDTALEETIREFAALDGAFIIRGDGCVMAAGTFLRAGLADAVLEQGLGARHAAAIGITAATTAVAIVISSSTGVVRVYMNGKLVVAIERPHRRT